MELDSTLIAWIGGAIIASLVGAFKMILNANSKLDKFDDVWVRLGDLSTKGETAKDRIIVVETKLEHADSEIVEIKSSIREIQAEIQSSNALIRSDIAESSRSTNSTFISILETINQLKRGE